MMNLNDCQSVERVADKMSGAWVFTGTRVPVSALFENLERGASPQQFVEWFEGVSLAQVQGVLNYFALETSAVH
jgi:uncharacterized protein (DUF433 family)